MNRVLRIRQVRIHRLAIPMRLKFEHAAAARATADPIVLELTPQSPFGELAGFGETLARAYVTGETADTVLDDLTQIFIPELLHFRAESFSEAVEFVDALPVYYDGRLVNAARAAVELAVLDLAGRAFARPVSEASSWLELPGFGSPGAFPEARYSGVVIGRRPARRRTLLRLQSCYGLRDFKLKVAVDGWEETLVDTARVLGPAIARGQATLRVDANAGWTLPQALDALPVLARCGVAALEQPLAPDRDDDLPLLATAPGGVPLMADESLRTLEDAQRLIADGAVRIFNVRIAKCGGLLPAWRIAAAALAAGREVKLGCLVGETSLLSAAGVAFLQACPRVRFVEGCFGRWLLRDDVVARPLQFGWRGRVRAPRGAGLGVAVEAERLRRLQGLPVVATTL